MEEGNVRKRFYKLNLIDDKKIHLSYGLDLEDQYENSRSLYKVIPKYTCKPLFINRRDNYFLFGQEFFEGKAIDELYNDSKIEEDDVTKILTKIRNIFHILEKPSSIESAIEEFNGFCNTILKNKFFSEIDFQILKKKYSL